MEVRINHDPIVTELSALDGYEAHALSGRTRVSILNKLNPWWWMLNTLEPTAPGWYLPDLPDRKRQVLWWLRNPFDGFTSYVAGVKDYDYTIRGKSPLDAGTPADAGKTGFKWSLIEMPIGLRWIIAFAALAAAIAAALLLGGWAWAALVVSATYFLPFAVLRLPAIAYAGGRVLWYVGWQWEGQLGAKFVIRGSTVQCY